MSKNKKNIGYMQKPNQTMLKYTKIPELKRSYAKLQKHFRSIGKLLLAADKEGDPFWKKADFMMKWPEAKGLCIGYSAKGTSGSGIGPALRNRLMKTAKLILDKGKTDPELFELIGIFEDNFDAFVKSRNLKIQPQYIEQKVYLYTS